MMLTPRASARRHRSRHPPVRAGAVWVATAALVAGALVAVTTQRVSRAEHADGTRAISSARAHLEALTRLSSPLDDAEAAAARALREARTALATAPDRRGAAAQSARTRVHAARAALLGEVAMASPEQRRAIGRLNGDLQRLLIALDTIGR